ncbi:hypothetical protein D9611_001535 [Ephemerocybe angulata]|uniref:Uncharacterized protein n=1 Tax=Ephemerocybe angulata TaxID=980116 RepID=A0A8H5CHM2_9AGAR|nr:hypothetical protein D9611_001535 [Tulosesus angulatus]
MSFFLRGFGGDAAECLGSRHAADVIDTMGRVVSTLGEGGPVAQLREVVEKRFGVAGLPEGYFYLTMQQGGLEMTNPATEIESTTKVVDGGNPENVFARGKNEDEKEHKRLEEAWNNQPGTEGDFMDFEEYVSLRESWLSSWAALYGRLVAAESARYCVSLAFREPEPVHVMYQDQLVRCFGDLTVVRNALLPNGMVSLYKAGRMA